MPTISVDQRVQTVITTFEVMPGVCHDVLDHFERWSVAGALADQS